MMSSGFKPVLIIRFNLKNAKWKLRAGERERFFVGRKFGANRTYGMVDLLRMTATGKNIPRLWKRKSLHQNIPNFLKNIQDDSLRHIFTQTKSYDRPGSSF
jgi:hypothetical protein